MVRDDKWERFLKGGAKICGLTDRPNFRAVLETGPEAIGLNFWSPGKRFLPPARAREWRADFLPEVLRVGVFVNAPTPEILALLEDGTIEVAQLHGDEDVAEIEALQKRGHLVIKAIRPETRSDLQWAESLPADALLVDAAVPGEYGGTGHRADWAAVGAHLRERGTGLPLLLSGGLRPGTVGEAITQAQPRAVDVASGVERSPGWKDPERVAAFLEESRAAFRELGA
ncbi:MAG: phosphoribosylanthranilate isomerase [Verrucomicrobiota bacterium]